MIRRRKELFTTRMHKLKFPFQPLWKSAAAYIKLNWSYSFLLSAFSHASSATSSVSSPISLWSLISRSSLTTLNSYGWWSKEQKVVKKQTKYLIRSRTFYIFSNIWKSSSGHLSELQERGLVEDESVREHVAPGCGQQIHFLQTYQLLLVKSLFACAHLDLHLAELFHLSVGVRVQLLRYLLHPVEGGTVLGASSLHSNDVVVSVLDCPSTKSIHLLVQPQQRHPHWKSLLSRVAHCFACRHHHFASMAFVSFSSFFEESTHSIFLLRQI